MTINRLAAAAMLAATMAAAPQAMAQTSQDFTARPASGPVECAPGTWQGLALGADGGPTAKFRRNMSCFTSEQACASWVMKRTSNYARIVQTRCYQR